MQLVHVRVMCFMLPTCFLSGPPVFHDAHVLFFAHIIVCRCYSKPRVHVCCLLLVLLIFLRCICEPRV